MKILIFSDSHLHDEVVINIIEFQKPDLVLCLGDLGNKLNPAFKDFVIVKGNNDFEDFPKELVYEYDGHKAFMAHGHYYNVEEGIEELVKKAKTLDCDTILYGHTHQPVDTFKDGIHVINPGSVMFPRNGKILIPTYCIYENGQYQFYHAKKNTLEDLFSEKPEVPKKSFIAGILELIKKLLGK